MRLFTGEWVLVALAAAVLGLMGWVLVMLWQESQAPAFELRKDEWSCTAEHTETRYRPQLVGKVTIMVPYTESVCDRWERRP